MRSGPFLLHFMSFLINQGLVLNKIGASQDPHKDLSPRRQTPWTLLSSLGTPWTLSSSYRALKNMIASIKDALEPSNSTMLSETYVEAMATLRTPSRHVDKPSLTPLQEPQRAWRAVPLRSTALKMFLSRNDGPFFSLFPQQDAVCIQVSRGTLIPYCSRRSLNRDLR